MLAIDLNPNAIGYSVLEFHGHYDENPKILQKGVFELSELTKKSGKASTSSQSKHLHAKLRRETIECAYKIDKLIKNWHCHAVATEDLHFKGVIRGGRENHRLCMNKWLKNLFLTKMNSLSAQHGYKHIEVNPCYTSYVGNIVYGDMNTPDMVAASIEIGRRGNIGKLKGAFFPSVKHEKIREPWKQTVSSLGWKKAFQEDKNAGVRYRIQLGDCKANAVFRKFDRRFKVYEYTFV